MNPESENNIVESTEAVLSKHYKETAEERNVGFHPIGPDEKVVFEGRKHWIGLLLRGIAVIIGAVIPLLIFIGIVAIQPDLLSTHDMVVTLGFYCLWLLILWIILFYSWTDYYLDIWIVTSKKLVDIDQNGFFSRKVSTLHLEKVQDATVHVVGLIATWLDFGDVIVQSAGVEHEFIIKSVAHPYDMKEAIMKAASECVNHTGHNHL